MMKSITLAICMALSLTNCQANLKATQDPTVSEDTSSILGEWKIMGGTVSFVDKTTWTADFECNNIRGTYELDGKFITIGNAISTRMSCPDTNEPQFLRAFQGRYEMELTSDRIILERDDSSLVLTR